MVAVVLERGRAGPDYVVGGDLNESGSGARHGDGRPVRLRGRRERRLVPAGAPVGRHRHERRARPRRLLSAAGSPRSMRAFAEFAARCGHVVACGDDPAVRRALELAGRRRRSPTDRSRRTICVLHVDALGPDGRARAACRCATGARSRCVCAWTAPHNLLERGRRDRGRGGSSASTPAMRGRGDRHVRRRPPAVRAPRRGARRGVLRRLRAQSDRDGGDGGDGPPTRAATADRARAAAPVLARAGAVARARGERRRGRPRDRDRRLRRRAGPDPGRHRQARGRWRPARRARAADRVPAAASGRGGVPGPRGPRRATSSSRWAAATCGCSATRRSSGSARRCGAAGMSGDPATAERILRDACGDASAHGSPAGAAHDLPRRRAGGAVPRGRVRARPRAPRPPLVARRGVAVPGPRQGLEPPRLRRRLPRAGGPARPGLPVGGARRRAADGGRRRCRCPRWRASRCGTAWRGWSSRSRSPRRSAARCG